MSAVILESWESVVAWARRYHDPNLPLYYSEQHVRILLDMIGAAMNRRQFRYVYAHAPLVEPIVSGEENVVFLSRYLVALYVNQPVRSPIDRVELVRDVDLVGELAPVLRSIGDTTRDRYDCHGLAATVADVEDRRVDGLPSCESGERFAQRFSEAENVRFHHLLRLALLVAHWHQHRVHGIPYGDHTRFRDLRLSTITTSSRLLALRRFDVDDDNDTENGDDYDDGGDDRALGASF